MPLKPITPNLGADKKIFLLKPRGFCAGVVRAIDVVKIALDLYGPPVYVRKEIVHNKHVVDELRDAGAVFVEELDEVPEGARAIFSAHGVAPAVRKQAVERHLDVIDATCPLVTKVHLEAVRFARDGFSIVLIGHKDHDEVIGTLGEVPDRSYLVETVEDVDRLELADPTRVRYLTQTTLSLDETRDIIRPSEGAVPVHSGTAGAGYLLRHRKPPDGGEGGVRMRGSPAGGGVAEQLQFQATGGSGRQLRRQVAPGQRSRRYRPAWLMGVKNVGVTAGASAPEHLVQELMRIPEGRELSSDGGNRTRRRRRTILTAFGADDYDSMSAPVQVGSSLESAAEVAIRRAAAWLAGLQQRDGHWCAELSADTTLESDYILFQLWLYPPQNGVWEPETRSLIDKAARAILDRQLPDGGFNIFTGGPSEVSASVKAYFALKLASIPIADERMTRLRNRILELGGIQAANSYVKVNLSLFNLYPRQYCPSIPPEVVLLPFDFLYQMSAWTRAIVVSLVDPARRQSAHAGARRVSISTKSGSPAPARPGRSARTAQWLTWHNIFLSADWFLKW